MVSPSGVPSWAAPRGSRPRRSRAARSLARVEHRRQVDDRVAVVGGVADPDRPYAAVQHVARDHAGAAAQVGPAGPAQGVPGRPEGPLRHRLGHRHRRRLGPGHRHGEGAEQGHRHEGRSDGAAGRPGAGLRPCGQDDDGYHGQPGADSAPADPRGRRPGGRTVEEEVQGGAAAGHVHPGHQQERQSDQHGGAPGRHAEPRPQHDGHQRPQDRQDDHQPADDCHAGAGAAGPGTGALVDPGPQVVAEHDAQRHQGDDAGGHEQGETAGPGGAGGRGNRAYRIRVRRAVRALRSGRHLLGGPRDQILRPAAPASAARHGSEARTATHAVPSTGRR